MAEIGRRFSYDDEGKPFMVLFKKVDPHGKVFGIKQADAWKFSEEHNELFISSMSDLVQQAYPHLGFRVQVGAGVYKKRICEMAAVVQEGIDELIEMPPRPKNPDDDIVVGEGVMNVGSDKHPVEIPQGMLNHGSL